MKWFSFSTLDSLRRASLPANGPSLSPVPNTWDAYFAVFPRRDTNRSSKNYCFLCIHRLWENCWLKGTCLRFFKNTCFLWSFSSRWLTRVSTWTNNTLALLGAFNVNDPGSFCGGYTLISIALIVTLKYLSWFSTCYGNDRSVRTHVVTIWSCIYQFIERENVRVGKRCVKWKRVKYTDVKRRSSIPTNFTI